MNLEIISDYDAKLSSMVTYGTANRTRLEISADQVAALTAAKESWDTAPPSRTQHHTIESSGNTQYNLVFDPENENMRAYLITWYINNRGEIGPESETLFLCNYLNYFNHKNF